MVRWFLPQNKQTSVGIVLEIGKTHAVVSHDSNDLLGGAVPCLKQDYLGRCASGDAEVCEIFVLGQERESMRFCILPDYRVASTA